VLHNPSDLVQSSSRINILVVSNSVDVQEQIKLILKSHPLHSLNFTETARDALLFIRQHQVDILLGDIDTPDIDGWRLSRLVRSGILECSDETPIIMITSTWCERIAEVTAREYGVNELLPREQLARIPQIIDAFSENRDVKLPNPRLLVVEDQPDTSDLIIRILGNSYAVDVAEDGQSGLEMWRQGRHDLVLLDLMLPKLRGKDVLLEIMRDDSSQAVVIMTAHATIDQAEELVLFGAVDFLPKPFRAEQLRKVCNIASLREDYLVSNAQFAARVDSLKERESAYKELYESHHQLLDELQSVVMKIDNELRINFLNRTWESLMGFDIDESLGKPINEFIDQEDAEKNRYLNRKLGHALANSPTKFEMELCFVNKKKQKLWMQLRASSSAAFRETTALTVCLDNITEHKQSQHQLEHLAMHDSLTDLYNRHYFELSLKRLAADAQLMSRQHGLIYLDLDYFKVINDMFGHQRGDEVLQEVAQMLQNHVGNADLLCRLGGDEFAILLNNVTQEEMREYATKVKDAISNCGFHLQEQRIHLSASIGLAEIDGMADTAEEYLKRADIALYVAKGRGRSLIHLFNPSDRESEQMRLNINWSQKIREAIDEERILLYFQPVFDVNKKEISYYESLVRYQEKNGDIVAPGVFIPALEKTGEMQLLDRKIIQQATKFLANYPQLHHVAVNLSAQAFKDDSLVPSIIGFLDKYGVDPERLTFELTESDSLFNLNVTQRAIAELHELGCSFSVDDFGSGFSSFSYLKQLPADYIKLDGSFIKNLHKDETDQALVRSIVQVIQALGKKAVAEYVENESILQILMEMGIDFVQGYHIGHPVPIESFENTLQ